MAPAARRLSVALLAAALTVISATPAGVAPAAPVARATAPLPAAFILDTLSSGSSEVVRAFHQPDDSTVGVQWNGAWLTVYASATNPSAGFVNYDLNAGRYMAIGPGTYSTTWSSDCSETLEIASISPALEVSVATQVTEISATFHRQCGTEDTRGIIRVGSTDTYAALGDPSGPNVAWSLSMTGAGTAFVGRTSSTATATLKNIGTEALTFGAPAWDVGVKVAWTLTGNTCTASLAPGDTCELTATALSWMPMNNTQDFLTLPVSTARGLVRIYTPSAFASAEYVPLNPTRVVDTRKALGATVLKTGVAQAIAVVDQAPADALVNVPPDAVAVTGNLTLIKPTSAGWGSLTTTPSNNPALKTLYAPALQITGNAVNLRLAEDGTLGLTWQGTAGSSTQAVLDITGYWRPVNPYGGVRSGNFRPYGPTRVVNNAAGKGFVGHLYAGKPKTFTVPLEGVWWENTAVTGVVTVVKPAQGGSIYLGPAAVAAPTTTALNFRAGDSHANGFFARLSQPLAYGSPKKLTITYVGAAGTYVDVYVDIHGILGESNGFGYVPLVPSRVVDSAAKKGLTAPLAAGPRKTVNVTNRYPADPSRNVPPDNSTTDGALLFKYGLTGNLWMVRPSAAGALSANPPTGGTVLTTTTIRSPALDRRACGIVLGAAGSGAGLVLGYSAPAGATTGVWFDVTGYFLY